MFGRFIPSALFLCGIFAAILALGAQKSHAQDITTGLVGHWKLDETTGTTAADSSGNGNNGALFNLDSSDWRPLGGRIRGAINFTASSGEGINTGFTSVDTSQPFTYTLWYKPPAGGEFNFVLAQNAGAPTAGREPSIEVRGNYVRFQFGDGATSFQVDSPEIIEFDEWNHVAIQWDGTDSVIYINGVEVTRQTTNTPTNNTSDNLLIGARFQDGSNPQDSTQGVIDDVRVYNRALSAEDVQFLYESFDGNIVYNTDSRVPQYFDGENWQAMGEVKYIPNAVNFDGVNDWLGLAGIGTNSQRVTVSLWLQKETTGTERSFAEEQINRFNWLSGPDDDVRFRITNVTSGALLVDSGSGDLSDSEWHHVLFSVDTEGADSNKVHLYIDGINTSPSISGLADQALQLAGNWEISDNISTFRWGGGMADFWVDIGTYIDLSIEANRRKFIDADGNPVFLGADGSLPTGTAPDIFLSGDTANWHTNKGTGGGFTENGALTDAPTKPGTDYLTCSSTGNLVPRGTAFATTEVLGVYTDGTYVYTAEGWSGGSTPLRSLRFDGSNFTEIDAQGAHNYPEGIWSDGTYIYLGVPGEGLSVYSKSNGNLTFLDSDTVNTTQARFMWGDGTYIYVPSGNEGIMAFTFNGTSLTKVGATLASNNFAHAVYADGTYIFIADQTGGLRMYTFDGSAWTMIDEDTSYDTRRIWKEGNYLYTATQNGVTAYHYDAGGLQELARYTATGAVRGIWASGNLVYAAAQTNGLHLLSFNGSQFTAIDTDTVNGESAFAVYGDNQFLYVGTNDSLQVFDALQCLTCQNPARPEGSIIYNADSQVMQYCDGENWQAMGPVPGDGTGGCSNPTRPEGSMVFNKDFGVMQYCEGDEWVSIGKEPPAAPEPCGGVGNTCPDGSIYAGLSPDGNLPMYTTPADAPATYRWNDSSSNYTDTSMINCTDASPGTASSCQTGEANTAFLTGATGEPDYPFAAAEYCGGLSAHGHNDWYLPASDELNVLFNSRNAGDLNGTFNETGALLAGYYWSSSEQSSSGARAQRFSDGLQYSNIKDSAGGGLSVRCVRR